MSAAFGFVYVIGYASFSYSAHNLQLKAAAMMHKGIAVPEQAADWGADFSPIKKSEISIQIARVAFSEHGQLRYYFDEAGKDCFSRLAKRISTNVKYELSNSRNSIMQRKKVQMHQPPGY